MPNVLASDTKVIGTGGADYGKVTLKRLLLVLILLLPSTARADVDGNNDILVTQTESDYETPAESADPAASAASSLEPSAEPLPECTDESTDVSSCTCAPDATATVCIGDDPSSSEDDL